MNINAINIIKNNLDKINWDIFIYTTSYTNIILQNINNISNWNFILSNEFAIDIIENNLDKFTELELFSLNKNIFTYDYKKIKQAKSCITEGLAMYFLHPNKIFFVFTKYLRKFS